MIKFTLPTTFSLKKFPGQQPPHHKAFPLVVAANLFAQPLASLGLIYLGVPEPPSYVLGHLDLWEQVHSKAVTSNCSLFSRFVQNLLSTGSGYGSNGGLDDARRLGAFLMAGDCNHITRNFGASWYGGCSWYTSAIWTPSELFQGMDCRHRLLFESFFWGW
jgi:hypothetical protein